MVGLLLIITGLFLGDGGVEVKWLHAANAIIATKKNPFIHIPYKALSFTEYYHKEVT